MKDEKKNLTFDRCRRFSQSQPFSAPHLSPPLSPPLISHHGGRKEQTRFQAREGRPQEGVRSALRREREGKRERDLRCGGRRQRSLMLSSPVSPRAPTLLPSDRASFSIYDGNVFFETSLTWKDESALGASAQGRGGGGAKARESIAESSRSTAAPGLLLPRVTSSPCPLLSLSLASSSFGSWHRREREGSAIMRGRGRSRVASRSIEATAAARSSRRRNKTLPRRLRLTARCARFRCLGLVDRAAFLVRTMRDRNRWSSNGATSRVFFSFRSPRDAIVVELPETHFFSSLSFLPPFFLSQPTLPSTQQRRPLHQEGLVRHQGPLHVRHA